MWYFYFEWKIDLFFIKCFITMLNHKMCIDYCASISITMQYSAVYQQSQNLFLRTCDILSSGLTQGTHNCGTTFLFLQYISGWLSQTLNTCLFSSVVYLYHHHILEYSSAVIWEPFNDLSTTPTVCYTFWDTLFSYRF